MRDTPMLQVIKAVSKFCSDTALTLRVTRQVTLKV